MDSVAYGRLEKLIASPGIAGNEGMGILHDFSKLMPFPLRKKAKVWPQGFATLEIGPEDAKHSLLMVAHADVNGLRVAKITEDGYLRFDTVGGTSSAHYLSSVVHVWSGSVMAGRFSDTPGVVGWKSLHTAEPEERKKIPEPKHLAIDIGTKSKAEVEALGIRIGDPITFDSTVTLLQNGLVAANGLDNRSGVWVVLETLYKTYREKANLRIVFAIAGAEEIGLVGSQKIQAVFPRFDFCIGTDVGLANDFPGDAGLRSNSPDISLGSGPIIYRGSLLDGELVENVMTLMQANNIPYQLESIGDSLGTDAMLFDRRGVRTVHFGIPCRYMHFKEVVSLYDLERTAELSAAAIKKIGEMQ